MTRFRRTALLVFTLLVLGTGCRKDPDLSFLKSRAEKLMESDKQKQRQTVADMRNLGTAMFSWLTDQVGAGAAGQKQIVEVMEYPSIPRAKLQELLVPQYIQSIPEKDGWGHPYDIRLNVANKLARTVLFIRSPGRDGIYSGEHYTVSSFPQESYDEDLVGADGFFVRWPQKPPGDDQDRSDDQGRSKLERLLQSGDETKQRQTVADMRNLGTAMFSWLTDQVGAGAAGQKQIVEVMEYPQIPRAKLQELLVPQYIQSLPEKDGWGHPYDIRLNVANKLAPRVLFIRSPGRDGIYSGESYTVSPFPQGSYDEDLVWADGFFVRWPQKPPGDGTGR